MNMAYKHGGRTPPEQVRARSLYIPFDGSVPKEVRVTLNAPRHDDADADEDDLYLTIGPADCASPFTVRMNKAAKEWLLEQLEQDINVKLIRAIEAREKRKSNGTGDDG